MIESSDVITLHNYAPPEEMKKRVDNLRRYRHAFLCSEYMARPIGSTFDVPCARIRASAIPSAHQPVHVAPMIQVG
jgi:hypothetical protein